MAAGRQHGAVLAARSADADLRADGVAVVRLLSAEAAAGLRDEFGALHGWSRRQLVEYQPPDFEIAVWDSDLGYQRSVAGMIDRWVAAPVAGAFLEHQPVARSIMVKWPSDGSTSWSGVPDAFHSDANCVDERTGARSYRVWLALQDVDERNGCLHIVPRSHTICDEVRGWDVEAPWLRHHEVLAGRSIPLALAAGEAAIFDPAVVHRSGPNTTGAPRVAVSLLMTRPDDQLCVFRRRDEHTADRVDVGREFFVDGSYNDLPDLPATEVLPVAPRELDEAELARALDRRAGLRRVRRRGSARPRR